MRFGIIAALILIALTLRQLFVKRKEAVQPDMDGFETLKQLKNEMIQGNDVKNKDEDRNAGKRGRTVLLLPDPEIEERQEGKKGSKKFIGPKQKGVKSR